MLNSQNIVITAWVKNVYRRYINQFINSVLLSPIDVLLSFSIKQINVKLGFIHQIVNHLNKYVSTTKNYHLYLLISSYTHNPQHLLLRPIKRI